MREGAEGKKGREGMPVSTETLDSLPSNNLNPNPRSSSSSSPNNLNKKKKRRRSGVFLFDNFQPGCMWGFLQFLDFNQRLRLRKMLIYRRHHGDGKHRNGARSKLPKIEENTSSGEDHICWDKKASLRTEGKVDAKIRSSGKARMRNLLLKRRSKDEDQMRKISPLAARLFRTISIHHMDSNDYVLPDELASDSKIIEADSCEHALLWPKASDGPNLHKRCRACGATDTVVHNQLDGLGNQLLEKQSLIREKLTEAKTALLNHKGPDSIDLGGVAHYRSEEFIMELLNANRELLFKILQDPSFVLANYLQTPQASSPILTKSVSFPVAGLPNRKTEELFRLKEKKKESESVAHQDWKLEAENSPSNPIKFGKYSQVEELTPACEVGLTKSEPATMDGTGTTSESLPVMKTQRNNGIISRRFKLIRQRIKDVIKENRKEHHHISLDGILHKIPYGHKVSKNVTKEIPGQQEGSASHKQDRDGLKSKFRGSKAISSSKKHSHKSMRRSHSLTESLDKYSRLFESISSKESRRLPEISKPVQEDGGLKAWKSSQPLKRIFSLPELDSYSLSRDIQREELTEVSSFEVPSSGLAVGNAEADMHGSDEPKPASTLVHMEENVELDTVTEHVEQLDAREEVVGGLEHDQGETCNVEEDLLTEDISNIALNEQGVGTKVGPSGMLIEPKPTSGLDAYFEEDPVRPARVTTIEDPEMKAEYIHYEEHNSLTTPERQLAVDVLDMVEGIEGVFDKLHIPGGLTGITSVHVLVDEKDEAEFNYVRDILWKSGFSGEEFLGAWYSPYQPVDPLLFEEVESSPHKLESTGYESDMSLDHQLLFDLINEVLLEIYESCFAYCPWIPRFDSRVKPMPVGYHVLEEVWASISWYLTQSQLDPAIECVVARDFAKDDGWMNLQADSEEIAFELEDLILDDLIDEIILEYGVF